jgi:hypothetical protein
VSDSDVVAKARVIYQQMQVAKLAETPLGRIGEWVRTGRPSPARELRDFGFTSEGAGNAVDLRLARLAFVREWGFSIPCAEAVGALADLAPLVEVGAGSAYWSALLCAAGVDIVATDPQPPGPIGYGFTVGAHHRVEPLDALAAVRAHPNRNVFCSFPSENGAWPAEMAAELSPGRALALIGDGRGGLTATDALFDLLDQAFDLETVVELPQFPKVNDRLTVYRRR